MKVTIQQNKSAVPPKMPTGIVGLDEITGGGLPRQRNTVVMGGPGCGKTLLALQTLVNGVRQFGEPGIFVAFEENTRQIVRNAASFGWDLPELERKNLFLLDPRTRPESLTAGDFDLVGFLASVGAQAKKMGAKRIVFDSIDVLLSLLDNVAKERREIHRLLDWLTESGLTGIITSKLEDDYAPAGHRYGFLQFMADCSVLLTRPTAQQFSQRELRVLKYRGSAFSENAAPMVIGSSGLEVAHIGTKERVFPVTRRRVSSGVQRLDAMLGGGYFQGSTILISGAPGTAKTTLAGAFVEAACRRGERALYVSFDEVAGEHARNLASVGIDLAPHLASGRLLIYAARSESCSLEEHVVRIHALIRQHRARAVVFDPLSALFRAGSERGVHSAAERLLQLTKSEGITTICTSLLASQDWRVEGTPLEVSTVADTWIHLNYAIQAGERNRALTIIKSRGMKHSNQVRELLLSNAGVSLADVYAGGGEVLMGTMRWERETAERLTLERSQAQAECKRHEIKLAETELTLQLETLRRELEIKRLELSTLAHDETQRLTKHRRATAALRRQRNADRPSANTIAPAGKSRR